MKKKSLTCILSLTFAFILELIPKGVKMNFAVPPGEPPIVIKTSYFDLLPFGYGNFFPILTSLLTSALLLLSLFYYFKNGDKLKKLLKFMSAFAFILSFGPLIFTSYTFIGAIISILLLINTFSLFRN